MAHVITLLLMLVLKYYNKNLKKLDRTKKNIHVQFRIEKKNTNSTAIQIGNLIEIL